MSYTKVLDDGTKISVPYWHDYCEKHKTIYKLRMGCEYCQREKETEQ